MQRHRWSDWRWRAIAFASLVALAAAAFQPSVAAQDEDSLTIPLKEYKNSGVSGTASLTARGDETRVSMELSGDPVTGNHPTHIHTGTCADFDPDPTYPLTTVILDEVSDEGVSETTVEDVRLNDLLRADYVILVHKSAEELTNYYVCGDIKVSASVMGSPDAGVGAAAADTFPLPVALGVLAVLAAASAAGLLLRGGSRAVGGLRQR